MGKKLAVITVNFENYSITEDFISYFKDLNTDNFKIFISDLSVKKQEIKQIDFVEIVPGENKGYAYGINLGLKKALDQGFKYFVVINNDTRINNSFTSKILESLEKNQGAIIGGKIYYEKGYEYHKDKYNKEDLGQVLWYAGGYVDWNNVFTIHRGVDEVDKEQYNHPEKTDFITGCLMCFDKSIINSIGFWDEKYFLYYEDADYCEKAKRKGIDLYYDSSIIIWHKNAQSTGGSGSKLHQRYQEKNRLLFGLKYAPLRTKIHLLKNYIFK